MKHETVIKGIHNEFMCRPSATLFYWPLFCCLQFGSFRLLLTFFFLFCFNIEFLLIGQILSVLALCVCDFRECRQSPINHWTKIKRRILRSVVVLRLFIHRPHNPLNRQKATHTQREIYKYSILTK